MEQQQLIPHLFRNEYRKITAVLCKLFGIEHIEIAEDIASETFLSALETWTYKGVPENPAAWLYTVAKNKASNYFRRHATFTQQVLSHVKNTNPASEEINIDLSNQNITDSQLQMLFAICNPVISPAAQTALALRILCGFGIDEIADAFLTNKETINKRLHRAREKLRNEKVAIEFPGADQLPRRMETVLLTLYLLFSEGYYSTSKDAVIRDELCLEAMRLILLLIENESTNLPSVNALYALMCFQASRLAARKSENGAVIFYNNQNEALWDYELISKGGYFLNQAATGNTLSKYHLEASIAYWHTIKADSVEKWENILQLFNQLLQLDYSPIAALNRTYALFRARGKMTAIAEAEKLDLSDNHFYFVLLGELYTGIDNTRANINFEKALELAKTQTDKQTIENKMYLLKER
jgi:RNA polymerase sigma-70 factor (ECF subfamily)